MLFLLRALRRFSTRGQRRMIRFHQIHFRRQDRPPARVSGFHERLTGITTIDVQDGDRDAGIPPERQ